ncbi:UPF0182 family membrane protein [Nocardioides panacis]|uniref:UPF0182 family membrane protein n=1 Tax=Nocardioides panacis TaxID=2849501 RepID=UPI0020B29810|nr:UPF0182 family protein [Nocardioides panacis]
MSGIFDDGTPERPRRVPPPGSQQRSRALIGTIIVLVVAFFLVSVFTGVWTDRLWFRSVGYSGVFTKVLGTKVLLFLVFGLTMGVVVAANVAVAYRFRPLFRPASQEQVNLDRYREVVDPLRKWLLIAIALVLGLFAGGSGAGQWRQFLLWRHRSPFGTTDPYFHKDVGFYVFDLPWLHYLVDFGLAVTVLSLIAAAVVHYLFGGIRLQSKRDRLSGAAQVQISVLAGLFVLIKGADYWLDRYNLTTDSGGLFTGVGYTDQNAVLPAKTILTFIAIICAILFFANVLRRTWLLPSVGLVLLVLSSILLGVIWPGIVQQFQVKPSEPDKEAPYIAANIKATRDAYDIAGTKVTEYDANQTLSQSQLRSDTESLPGIRLLDPALVSEAFEQLQQVRGYYSVAPVLDVDRYQVDGRTRDMVVAVRELDQNGLPDGQRNWANEHTVYTHGYGVVAAYGNQQDKNDNPVTGNDGKPVWAERDLPPKGDLTNMFPNGYQPRIYFGEKSTTYAIVGKAPGGKNVELDLPEGQGANSRTNTYEGQAGVPVGGLFNKLMYAIKFSEPNIVLSSRVNANSKILYDRAPRERVQKVAPWLTVDGDSYPAVVDGRVKWILDGYTTTDHYPNSEKDSLRSMTSDALSPNTTYATLPTDEINYMRNSVKAVVDAYDGSVKLYQWDDKDPILKAWEGAFPGIVEPKSKISPDLLAHMRYPEDMFKVQRNMLATYHVTNPKTFYGGTDQWKVPEDPENKANKQPPYRLSVRTPSGGPDPVFSLTSVFVPQKRQNLASFISVDADAGQKDYGTIRILRLPSNTQIPGPSQIANLFGADSDIQDKLLAFTRTNSTALFGNLLTLPVGDGLLYVQPLYTQRKTGEGRYPVLRYVLVSFGEKVGIGNTLTEALNDVLGLAPDAPSGADTGGTTGSGGTTGGGAVSSDVRQLLQQAETKFATAQKALQSGDLEGYAKAQGEARDLVQQAIAAANKATPTPSPSATPSPSGSSSPSPSASPSN